jgi:hypothetical protein
LAFFAVNFLLFSCATVPQTPDPFLDESGFLPLEPGGRVYMLVDVPACRPVLDRLMVRYMDQNQSRELLSRTGTAAAAFYPRGHERRFQAAAWGNYPGFRGNLALAAGKDWKRRRSKTGGAYYYSAGEGLSVALTASRAFAAGAEPGDGADPFTEGPGTEIPEGFAGFRQGTALSLWLTDPAAPADRFFAALEIPLRLPAEQLFVGIFPHRGEDEAAEARYEALVRIQAPAASQARALFTLFNMLSAAPVESAEGTAVLADLLFANPPVLDGRNITLKTADMDAEGLALLFKIFSIYSD